MTASVFFASDSWRVSLCFRSLYIAYIMWNYIQARLGSLWLSYHNCTLIVGKVVCLVYLAVLFVSCLGYLVLKVDISGGWRKKVKLSFWIESDSCRFSLCFRSMHIAYILRNYIKANLVSLCLALLLIKLDILLTSCATFCLGFMIIIPIIDTLDNLG